MILDNDKLARFWDMFEPVSDSEDEEDAPVDRDIKIPEDDAEDPEEGQKPRGLCQPLQCAR